MVFNNIINPRSEFPQKGTEFYKKLIKRSASIGANVTVLCGLTIGKYCLTGAGAVVTKDAPDFSLVVGNPGKIVGWVNKKGNKLDFNKNGESICGKFVLRNNILLRK